MSGVGRKGVSAWSFALLMSCAAGCGGNSSQKMVPECNGTFTVNGTAMSVCMFGTAAPSYTQISANAPGGYPSVTIQTNMSTTGSFQSSTPQNGNTVQYDPDANTGWSSLDGGTNGQVKASITINVSQLSATSISFTASGTLVEFDKTSDPLNPATMQFDASGSFQNN